MPAGEATREAAELLNGAVRKVAMAQYHARELARVLDEPGPYEIVLQAHFEGLLYAGISAQEKLTLAVGNVAGVDCDSDTNRLVMALRRHEETEELGRRIATWLAARENGTTLAKEARTLRNAATHGFYDKRGGPPPGEWHYQVEVSRGEFRDGLVLEFAEAYARHVEELRTIAETVAERWELQVEAAPVEA